MLYKTPIFSSSAGISHLLKLSGFLILTIVLQSCQPKPGSWKNAQINAGKREDFHELNKQVFKSLQANDPAQLSAVMSKELLEDPAVNRTIELISNGLKPSGYKMFDEYYIVSDSLKADTIKTTGRGINDYNVCYVGIAKEMYIAFFTLGTANDQSIITAVYGKYDYGWKLNELDLNQYTINGKTASEFFKLANEKINKNQLVDAMVTMELASNCLRPSDIWKYHNDREILTSYGKLMNVANEQYHFPFTLTQVSTAPKIFRIFNQTIPQGTYPMIYYLTKINLNDTTKLKEENANIKKEIGKVMPGIDNDKNYVLYAAFNELPAVGKTVAHYDMTDNRR
jgi:hypothetical protein